MSGSLDYKLDRIVGRAAELNDQLSEGLGGDGFSRASKELSELNPIVARIGELRAAERAHAEAEAMLADPEMKDLAEAELYDLKDRLPALRHEIRLALLPKDEVVPGAPAVALAFTGASTPGILPLVIFAF